MKVPRQKHYGYANYDTWKVAVHIDNTRPIHNFVKRTKNHLLAKKKPALIATLKNIFRNYAPEESINWSVVSSRDIKQTIKDTY